MAHDALAAHARDELGISDLTTARPVQAAFASAGTFAIGAAMPLVTALVTPRTALIPVVIATSILFLALLGGFGAHAGGAPVMKAAFRVTFWGALAMGLDGWRGRIIWGCRLTRLSDSAFERFRILSMLTAAPVRLFPVTERTPLAVATRPKPDRPRDGDD